MKIINKLKEKFSSLKIEEKLILLLTMSLFIHYIVAAIMVLVIVAFTIKKSIIKELYMNCKNRRSLSIFIIMISIVSIIYSNWAGLAISFGFALFIIVMLFYRKYINRELFECMTICICILGFFNLAYSIIEYKMYCDILGNNFFDFIIVEAPKYRVHNVYFNANYYAMMLQFICIACIYRIFKSNNTINKLGYFSIILSQLFCLYLTGCRTVWPSMVMSVAIMCLFCIDLSKVKLIILGVLGGIGTCVIIPILIPRLDKVFSAFDVRVKIWKTGLKIFADTPLFGRGPHTYMIAQESYNGHPTQHCHSVYLDPFVSFGIIGVALLVPYFWNTIKDIFRFTMKREYKLNSAIIIATISSILIHGTLDYTIMWIQTGILAMLFIYNYEAFKGETDV